MGNTMVSYKKQELPSICEHLESPKGVLVGCFIRNRNYLPLESTCVHPKDFGVVSYKKQELPSLR